MMCRPLVIWGTEGVVPLHRSGVCGDCGACRGIPEGATEGAVFLRNFIFVADFRLFLTYVAPGGQVYRISGDVPIPLT